mgnify:CR=1 FL=1
MGGFFGVASKNDCMVDVFFGTDYHSHLGTRRGGMAAFDDETGLQRQIHNIENSPFRTRFENIFDEMKGNSAIGCISSMEPQPLLIRSGLGAFAICFIGIINNADELIEKYLSHKSGFFNAMTGGRVNSVELLAALISLKEDFVSGIQFAQEVIDGTASVLILKEGGHIIAARDKMGRLPVIIGKDENGHCVTFESFAAKELEYEIVRELGPGEIVVFDSENIRTLVTPGKDMKICTFLWVYYGYPTTDYAKVGTIYKGEGMTFLQKIDNFAFGGDGRWKRWSIGQCGNRNVAHTRH